MAETEDTATGPLDVTWGFCVAKLTECADNESREAVDRGNVNDDRGV